MKCSHVVHFYFLLLCELVEQRPALDVQHAMFPPQGNLVEAYGQPYIP